MTDVSHINGHAQNFFDNIDQNIGADGGTKVMLDASGNVLYTRLAKNVPLKRDGITKITGTIFTSSSISIKIETPWSKGETEYDIDINQ